MRRTRSSAGRQGRATTTGHEGHGRPAAGPAPRAVTALPLGQTVAAFLALKRAGGLLEGPRAELIAGVVAAPSRLGPREAAALILLERTLRTALEEHHGAIQVASAAAFRLGPSDLLHADLALLREPPGAAGIGGSHDPRAAPLVIEVVRGRASHAMRAPLYAAGGAKELWLLDVDRGWTEVLRSPWRGLYRSRTLWYPGESVPVAQLDGLAVAALPRP